MPNQALGQLLPAITCSNGTKSHVCFATINEPLGQIYTDPNTIKHRQQLNYNPEQSQ